MKQTPAADARRGTHPRPGAARDGAAHGTGIPGVRTHGRGAARSQVQSSLVFKNTGFLVFINTGGHAMRRIVP